MKGWHHAGFMTNAGQLHMLTRVPSVEVVRGLLEHLDIPHERVQVNPMKQKKTLPSAPEWTKVPVWVDSQSGVHVDSTPIMKQIDAAHNEGKLWASDNEERRDERMEWVDLHMSKATIPILYGSLGSALKTTVRVSKLEKFGFISKRCGRMGWFPNNVGNNCKKACKERR